MKSFVYLDEYKMYSLSSQLMKGVTDYIVQESSRAESDSMKQAGPQDSGRKLAEIIETASANVEKRFLHDYAYLVFEEKLKDSGLISDFDSGSEFSEIVQEDGKSKIVRVRAKARLLDSRETVKALENLVDIQQALEIVSTNDERESLIAQIIFGQDAAKPNRAAVLELGRLSKSSMRKETLENNKLQYKNLASVLSYGYKNRLDLSMQLSDCSVSADLKRSCLKDEEDFIVKTYSRETDVELVMLGIVTRVRPKALGDDEEQKSEDDIAGDQLLSTALINSNKALHGVESLFTKIAENQVILDPIAVYLEV